MNNVILKNPYISIEIPKNYGPRISSLRYLEGANLLAELPNFVTQRPDGKNYHFYGGHRLWIAPEDPLYSYSLDDSPVDFSANGLNAVISKEAEAETGIRKEIRIYLSEDRPSVLVSHSLKNESGQTKKMAAWAITQLVPGGRAVIPMNKINTGLLPNRIVALWPYTNISVKECGFFENFIAIKTPMAKPFKIGVANQPGWIAYCIDKVCLIKKSSFIVDAEYPDYGCSAEFYCNDQFVELESLSPLYLLEPGCSIEHNEEWLLMTVDNLAESDDFSGDLFSELTGLVTG